jgi:hypothetical protein
MSVVAYSETTAAETAYIKKTYNTENKYINLGV